MTVASSHISRVAGKFVDNGSGVRTTDGDALTPSDNYNLRAERGRSAFDFRHRFTNSFLYELPFGKGKTWMNRGGVANAVLGGWQLGGIITFQSGFPASIFCGPGNWQNNDSTCYGDATGINPDLSGDQRGPSRFFNTAAFVNRAGFANNAANSLTSYRYGNAGRNVLTGPRIVDVDASIIKLWALGETRRLEFRAEFYNAWNTTMFDPPNTTVNSASSGLVNSTLAGGGSRNIQLSTPRHF